MNTVTLWIIIFFRIFVIVLVGISILWIPLIKAAQQGQLFLYIQALTGYIAPPICSVFLLAVFVPRVTEKVLNLHQQWSEIHATSGNNSKLWPFLAGCFLGYGSGTDKWVNPDGSGLCLPLPWVRSEWQPPGCCSQGPFYLLLCSASGSHSSRRSFCKSPWGAGEKQIGKSGEWSS